MNWLRPWTEAEKAAKRKALLKMPTLRSATALRRALVEAWSCTNDARVRLEELTLAMRATGAEQLTGEQLKALAEMSKRTGRTPEELVKYSVISMLTADASARKEWTDGQVREREERRWGR